VLDSGAHLASAEAGLQLALESGKALAAEEQHDVVGLDRLDRDTNEGLVEILKRVATLKDDVGRVLDLHQAPVIGAVEDRGDGAEMRDVEVEDLVESPNIKGVGNLLGSVEIIDIDEGVIDLLEPDAFRFELAS